MTFQTIPTSITDGFKNFHTIPNFRDFAFVVTPKLKFEFHNDYHKMKLDYKNLKISYINLPEEEKRNKKKVLEYGFLLID